jgi:acyl carrier protein
MSPPGRPKGEYRRAQPEATPASAPALQAAPRPQRAQLLADGVADEMRAVLQMAPNEALPADQSFFDLGFTSLGVEEMKQRLEERLACRIDAEVLFNHPTLGDLLDHLKRGPLAALFDPPAAVAAPAQIVHDGAPEQAHEQALAGGLLDRLLRG